MDLSELRLPLSSLRMNRCLENPWLQQPWHHPCAGTDTEMLTRHVALALAGLLGPSVTHQGSSRGCGTDVHSPSDSAQRTPTSALGKPSALSSQSRKAGHSDISGCSP